MRRVLALAALLFLFLVGFAGAAGTRAVSRVCATITRTVTTTVTSVTTVTTTVISTVTSTVTTTITGPTTTVTVTTGGGNTVAYRADYETGDFSQWWKTQYQGAPIGCGGPCTIDNVGNTSASIINAPVAQGGYAAQFTASSSGGGSSTVNRAELLASTAQTGGTVGQDWYYGWWTRFPGPSQVWWPNGDDWNDIFQFFDATNNNSWITGGIAANNGTPKLYSDGPTGHVLLTTSLQYDHWYHFVAHFNWETSATGTEQLWLDGAQVINATGVQTMPSTSTAITYSQGFYSARNTDNVVLQDGFCRAATFADASNC